MFKMIGYFITENLNFYFMFGLNKIIYKFINYIFVGFFFYMKYFLLFLIDSMCGEREREREIA